MMKYFFKNDGELCRGIEILASDRGFEITSEADAQIVVDIERVDESILRVTLDGNNAKIVYGGGRSRFFRALSYLLAWNKDGIAAKAIVERPLFESNGVMVDMSRGAVMNAETVKYMLRKMALMGMSSYMLYTEDTYEVDGHPYFGYMRGRYTKAELRELDSYALDLGIELIPCVQFLGHLSHHLRWLAAKEYKDTDSTLLVGADATYELIGDMIKTISECFTTKRLHMGMDEAHDLGVGAYLEKYGYKERSEILLEHLGKLVEMTTAAGFKPMMWSDMFFRLAGKGLDGYVDYDTRVIMTEEIKAKVPKEVQQVFWDYYNADEEFYSSNIEKHKDFGDDTIFAGGIWTWSGFCPRYSASIKFSYPALDACKKGGIREIFTTIWFNGAETSPILGIAGLAWYADYDYRGGRDDDGVRECFKNATDLSYDDFMLLELPEHPHGNDICASRSLVYNDPLLGLVDRHIGDIDTVAYYKNTSAKLQRVSAPDTPFEYAIETVKAVSSLLENKGNYGVRLKAAYDRADGEALKALIDECDVIIEKIKVLREAHKKNWFACNKHFGWELHDLRYGGLIMRFETVKERIADYLDGRCENIEELDEERLRINSTPDGTEAFTEDFNWRRYPFIASPNKFDV